MHAISTPESLTVHFPTGPAVIRKTHPKFIEAKILALHRRWEDLKRLMLPAFKLEAWSKGDFTYREGRICYEGEPLPGNLHQRAVALLRRGDRSFIHFLAFWERLMRNPSYRVVHQLDRFLTESNIPIGPGGYLYAYKTVAETDGKLLSFQGNPRVANDVGCRPSEGRNQISDDPNVSCGPGMHAGSKSYLVAYRSDGTYIVVRIDPEDVVSVPFDHNSRKMRTCEYIVVGILANKSAKLPDAYWDASEHETCGLFRPGSICPPWERDPKILKDMEDFLNTLMPIPKDEDLFAGLTRKQLRQICQDCGWTGFWKLGISDLIQFIADKRKTEKSG